MLSQRQRQCLRGIGIPYWRGRDSLAIEADPALNPAAPSTELPETRDFAAADLESLTPTAATLQASSPATGADRVSAATAASPNLPTAADPQVIKAVTNKTVEIPPLDDWSAIHSAIEACNACALAQNCTRKVPGIGNQQADLLIIGEGPGHDEDLRGEPFVGRSGQLLDRMLAAIGFARDQVYITNIVKCRPPSNRDPKPEEAQQCRAYLDAQIAQLAPRVILSVGRVSAHNLLGSNLPVGQLIKQEHHLPGTDIPLKVSYHPAYLLRNPAAKAIAWQDLKQLHQMLQ